MAVAAVLYEQKQRTKANEVMSQTYSPRPTSHFDKLRPTMVLAAFQRGKRQTPSEGIAFATVFLYNGVDHSRGNIRVNPGVVESVYASRSSLLPSELFESSDCIFVVDSNVTTMFMDAQRYSSSIKRLFSRSQPAVR